MSLTSHDHESACVLHCIRLCLRQDRATGRPSVGAPTHVRTPHRSQPDAAGTTTTWRCIGSGRCWQPQARRRQDRPRRRSHSLPPHSREEHSSVGVGADECLVTQAIARSGGTRDHNTLDVDRLCVGSTATPLVGASFLLSANRRASRVRAIAASPLRWRAVRRRPRSKQSRGLWRPDTRPAIQSGVSRAARLLRAESRHAPPDRRVAELVRKQHFHPSHTRWRDCPLCVRGRVNGAGSGLLRAELAVLRSAREGTQPATPSAPAFSRRQVSCRQRAGSRASTMPFSGIVKGAHAPLKTRPAGDCQRGCGEGCAGAARGAFQPALMRAAEVLCGPALSAADGALLRAGR